MNSAERQREKYKPSKVNVLLLGESPPSGGTFFYLANSNLYRAIKKGFNAVYGDFEDDWTFLSFFQNNNFFLDDLCINPVNNLSAKERKKERLKGVDPLAEKIRKYQPRAIIIVMKAIQPQIFSAITKAGIESIELIATTSFPGGSEKNRLDCIEQTKAALRKCQELGINK